MALLDSHGKANWSGRRRTVGAAMMFACLACGTTSGVAQQWTGVTRTPSATADPAMAWGEEATPPVENAVQAASATSVPLARWTPTPAEAPAGNPHATPSPAPAAVAPSAAARVQSPETTGYLPREQGQVWTEYNIRPYTVRVTETSRPEQAIISWILHTTGWEAWHGDTLAILNATPERLMVYHTPEMQRQVAVVVQRFLNASQRNDTFGLRIVTVGHPGWRARFHALLRPTPVQTPGVGAWILERESAAQILAELQRRSEFKEHSAPFFSVTNGQPGIVSSISQRSFVRDVRARPDVWPGYETNTQVLDTGFALEFVPLLDLDGVSVEATIRLDIDQLEKMVPVSLDMPTELAPRQSTRTEVPQMSHFRMHEKFRWPIDRVLLIDLGMVPLPTPGGGTTVGPLPLPLGGEPRANVLLFVEWRGPLTAIAPQGASPDARTTLGPSTRGRY